MNLSIDPSLGGFAYVIVFVAAALEGEVVFATASVLAGLGQLDTRGVLVAGALGGSAGDQFYFYVCRGPVQRWLSRIPWLAERRDWIVRRVRSHAVGMVLACRFLPGLRVAIPVSCAFAGVPPLQFSVLNLISAFAWAALVLELVTRWGPQLLQQLGLTGWWATLLPIVFLVGFGYWLSRSMSGNRGTISQSQEQHKPESGSPNP